MIDAVVAGHLCVDIIPQITDPATATSGSFLVPGRLTEVGGAVLATGGAVSNTGIALFKLGLDVRLVARIGDDLIANVIRDILHTHDPVLVENLGVTHGEPSSYTIVISPPGIDRTFLHCPGTNNTFGPDDVPSGLLAQARYFHFGYPPLMRRMFADGGVALSTILRQAQAQGVTTSLDMAMPDPSQPSGKADWPAILRRTLPYVDVFVPSVEELLYMLWRERYDELQRAPHRVGMIDALTPAEISRLAEQTLALGAQILMLKLGHRGIYLRTTERLQAKGRGAPADVAAWAQRELWAPCFRVNVVSTAGSGDSAIAGFISGLLRGQAPEGAVTSAVAVGACNVEAADTTSGVRSWRKLWRVYARVGRGSMRMWMPQTGFGMPPAASGAAHATARDELPPQAAPFTARIGWVHSFPVSHCPIRR